MSDAVADMVAPAEPFVVPVIKVMPTPEAAAPAPAPEVPVETPSPASDPKPAIVTDNSSERISATPPPSPTLSPALRPGPTPVSPVIPEPPVQVPRPAEAPVMPEPQEVPAPAQASPEAPQAPAQPPAASTPVQVTIKDRLYAALEKIRFNKRKKLDKIVQLAAEKGSIKNDDVQIAVRVSHATATNYLNELVRSGRLKRVGDAHQPTYEPL